jgi:hypothetical protein
LALLGKYVPSLKFVDVLLGDQPALEPHVRYYQRLLARDQDEASESARDRLKAGSLTETYDDLLIPGLVFAKRDRDDDRLDDETQTFVMDATRDIIEEVTALRAKTDRAAEMPIGEESATRVVDIVGCPARDRGDELGLLMLRSLLDPARVALTITTTSLLAAEVVELVQEKRPSMLCISALPPGGIAQVRLLCLRLRARFPDLKILVGRWGQEGDATEIRDQLLAAGADEVTTSLAQTCKRVSILGSIGANGLGDDRVKTAVA